MCVLFTEEVGGVLMLQYEENGNLNFITEYDEGDLLYDEIGSHLKIKQLRKEKTELLEALEMYYKVFVLGERQYNVISIRCRKYKHYNGCVSGRKLIGTFRLSTQIARSIR